MKQQKCLLNEKKLVFPLLDQNKGDIQQQSQNVNKPIQMQQAILKEPLIQLIQIPDKLRLLILAGVKVDQQELAIISQCVNLFKIDLSSTGLSQLPSELCFSNLQCLQLLYLHNNMFSDLQFFNPICMKKGLRHYVINNIDSLLALDFNIVLDEERLPYLFSEQIEKENLSTTQKQQNMKQNQKQIEFNLQQKQQQIEQLLQVNEACGDESKDDDACFLEHSQLIIDEKKKKPTKIQWPLSGLEKKTTEEDYMQQVRQEIYTILSMHSKVSVILRIQKLVKGWLQRKKYILQKKVFSKHMILARNAIIKWRKYINRRREIQSLMNERNFHSTKLKNAQNVVHRFRVQFQQRKKVKFASIKILNLLLLLRCRLQSFIPHIGDCLTFFVHVEQVALLKNIINQILNRNDINQQLLVSLQAIIFNPVTKETINIKRSNISVDETQNNKSSEFNFITLRVPYYNPSFYTSYYGKLQLLITEKAKQQGWITKGQFQQVIKQSNRRLPILQTVIPGLTSIIIMRKKEFGNLYSQSLAYHSINQKLNQYVNVHPVLNTFKKRQLQPDDLVKINQQIERVKRFQEKQYFQLCQVQVPDLNTLIFLIKKIIIHNWLIQQDLEKIKQGKSQCNDKTYILLCFFEKQLQIVSAAIKIQCIFRSYLTRKRQGIQLNHFFNVISKKRAIIRLQHWFRNIKWYHRIAFFREIGHHLQLITKPQLYIYQDLYFNLPLIIMQVNNDAEWLESNMISQKYISNKDNKHILKRYNQNEDSRKSFKNRIKFLEQQSMVVYNPKSGNLQLIWDLKSREGWEFDKQKTKVFPKSLNLIEKEDVFKRDKNDLILEGDIMHVLHTGSKVTKIAYAGTKYLRFEFKNVEEAKYRAATFSLMMYQFCSQGRYVSLMPFQIVEDAKKQEFYQETVALVYNINIKVEPGKKYENEVIDQQKAVFLTLPGNTQFQGALKFNRPDQRIDSKTIQTYLYSKQPKSLQQVKIKQNLISYYSTTIYLYINLPIMNTQNQPQIACNNIKELNQDVLQKLQSNTIDIEERAKEQVKQCENQQQNPKRSKSQHKQKDLIIELILPPDQKQNKSLLLQEPFKPFQFKLIYPKNYKQENVLHKQTDKLSYNSSIVKKEDPINQYLLVAQLNQISPRQRSLSTKPALFNQATSAYEDEFPQVHPFSPSLNRVYNPAEDHDFLSQEQKVVRQQQQNEQEMERNRQRIKEFKKQLLESKISINNARHEHMINYKQFIKQEKNQLKDLEEVIKNSLKQEKEKAIQQIKQSRQHAKEQNLLNDNWIKSFQRKQNFLQQQLIHFGAKKEAISVLEQNKTRAKQSRQSKSISISSTTKRSRHHEQNITYDYIQDIETPPLHFRKHIPRLVISSCQVSPRSGENCSAGQSPTAASRCSQINQSNYKLDSNNCDSTRQQYNKVISQFKKYNDSPQVQKKQPTRIFETSFIEQQSALIQQQQLKKIKGIGNLQGQIPCYMLGSSLSNSININSSRNQSIQINNNQINDNSILTSDRQQKNQQQFYSIDASSPYSSIKEEYQYENKMQNSRKIGNIIFHELQPYDVSNYAIDSRISPQSQQSIICGSQLATNISKKSSLNSNMLQQSSDESQKVVKKKKFQILIQNNEQ